MVHPDENLKYAALGRLYRLRELQTQRELIDREITSLEQQLGVLDMEPLKKRNPGRPSKTLMAAIEAGEAEAKVAEAKPSRAKSGGSSWAGMTPEQRSAEMLRRMEVRKQKQAAKETEEKQARRSEALRSARKKYWDGLTPRQQAAHVAKMRKGRKAQHLPHVTLVNGAAAGSIA
jgi:hypothetical protein